MKKLTKFCLYVNQPVKVKMYALVCLISFSCSISPERFAFISLEKGILSTDNSHVYEYLVFYSSSQHKKIDTLIPLYNNSLEFTNIKLADSTTLFDQFYNSDIIEIELIEKDLGPILQLNLRTDTLKSDKLNFRMIRE